ncbi:hypothetical protein MMC24_002406 [Lignoscripta atroalba]|nr:hypothetical protein [Lignoscripta atroalba]
MQETRISCVSASNIAKDPSVDIIGTDQERRGFDFFRSRTGRELDRKLDSSFWTRLILQASHSDIAVRHAVIALGSLNERFEINGVLTLENDQANTRHDFARLQYYKAISQLCKQLSSDNVQSVAFTLASCFLFICFEFMQGNDTGILLHLRSGLDILHRSQTKEGGSTLNDLSVWTSSPDDPTIDIRRVFTIIVNAAHMWLGVEPFICRNITPIDPEPDTGSLITEDFLSLEEADDSLDCQMRLMYYFQRSATAQARLELSDHVQLNTNAKRQELSRQLDKWPNAMEALLVKLWDRLSSEELHRAKFMIINHKITSMVLAATFQPDEEAVYREFEGNFDQIISLATSLLRPVNVMINSKVSRLSRESDAVFDPLGMFSFTASLIRALYFTAIKTRNRSTCQKAISLLSVSPWREGAWDSAAMAKIAERKVCEFEEQGLYRRS